MAMANYEKIVEEGVRREAENMITDVRNNADKRRKQQEGKMTEEHHAQLEEAKKRAYESLKETLRELELNEKSLTKSDKVSSY